MKKLIVKLLGLESLVYELNTLKNEVLVLTDENKELTNRIKHLDDEVNALEERVQEKIDEIETPDMDDFVREDDVNDRIESYLNDNDYVTQSYCDDEIETKVSDAVESAIDDADIDSKIESAMEDFDIENKVAKAIDLLNTRPDDKVEAMVKEAVKVTLERVIKAMADQQG